MTTCPTSGTPWGRGGGTCDKGVCNVRCKHLFGIFYYDAGVPPKGEVKLQDKLSLEFSGASTTKHTCFGGMGKCTRCKATFIDRTNVFESDWGACEKKRVGTTVLGQVDAPEVQCLEEVPEGYNSSYPGPLQWTPGEDITMDKFVSVNGEKVRYVRRRAESRERKKSGKKKEERV